MIKVLLEFFLILLHEWTILQFTELPGRGHTETALIKAVSMAAEISHRFELDFNPAKLGFNLTHVTIEVLAVMLCAHNVLLGFLEQKVV